MNKFKSIHILLLLLLVSNTFLAQNKAVLTLDETIRRVVTTYPSVNQAQEAVKSAAARLNLVKAAFLPVLNASASFTRIEPVATVHLGEMDLLLDPKNNYHAGISLQQLIYDFGRNRPIVEAAKEREELSRLQQEELYQTLALNTVQVYYLNCLGRQAIRIKQQELDDYDEMLRQVEVRTKAGSATSFDLLNTQVSQSAVYTQLSELKANLQKLQVQLSILADTVVTEDSGLNESFEISRNLTPLDELLTTAYISRPEMQLVDKQITIAGLEERAARRAFNPSLGLAASAGAKNGYPMNLDRIKLNYEVGVALSIPLYEGSRRKQHVSIARSSQNTALFQRELVKKQIQQQVSDHYFQLAADYDKIEQLTRQVMLAQKAYEQAKVNYKAGTVTNLELITGSTNLSGSKLQLLQARINYLETFYRLRVSMGERIW